MTQTRANYRTARLVAVIAGLLGTALAGQDRLAQARLALECSLSLEPARAAARERLADVATRGAAATPSPKPCPTDRP